MKIVIYSIVWLGIILIALYIGKTNINLEEHKFVMERPLTAVFFLLTMIAATFNK